MRDNGCRWCKISPAAEVSPHQETSAGIGPGTDQSYGLTVAGAFVISNRSRHVRGAQRRGDQVSVRSRSGWAPRRERTAAGRAVITIGTRYVVIDGQTVIDPRQTRAWRQLVDQVVAEEPLCWLELPGCTGTSTTGDHLVTVTERPDLALVRDNVRGACRSCNYKRGNLPVEAIDALRSAPGHMRTDDPLSIFAARSR